MTLIASDEMKVGIDLGGTTIEIIALGENGEGAFRKCIATLQGQYHGTLAAIVSLVVAAEKLRVRAVWLDAL